MSRTKTICQGSRYHSPVYYEVDTHHLYPKYLCHLLGIPERPETIALCALDHDNLHHVIRHYINEGSPGGHRLSVALKGHVDAAWQWWENTILAEVTLQ